jgi:hypothetical protein
MRKPTDRISSTRIRAFSSISYGISAAVYHAILYDNAKGHDHALYLAVLEEAKYFQIPRLEKWLEDKAYLEAVKTTYSETVRVGANLSTETTQANTEIVHKPFWITEKAFVCPYGRHDGHPEVCRKICIELGKYRNAFIDMSILKVLVIQKTVEIEVIL